MILLLTTTHRCRCVTPFDQGLLTFAQFDPGHGRVVVGPHCFSPINDRQGVGEQLLTLARLHVNIVEGKVTLR